MISLLLLLSAEDVQITFFLFLFTVRNSHSIAVDSPDFCRNTVAYLWNCGGGGRFRFPMSQY